MMVRLLMNSSTPSTTSSQADGCGSCMESSKQADCRWFKQRHDGQVAHEQQPATLKPGRRLRALHGMAMNTQFLLETEHVVTARLANWEGTPSNACSQANGSGFCTHGILLKSVVGTASAARAAGTTGWQRAACGKYSRSRKQRVATPALRRCQSQLVVGTAIAAGTKGW